VKGGKDVTVTGCVDRFEDGGYLLTNDVGGLKYVLVTKDNLSKYVGKRVEVKGESTDGDSRLVIKKEVGTTGEVAGEKTDDHKTKRTTELKGEDVDFPYLGVKSV